MKYKWKYEENKSFKQVLIILLGETLSGEIFVGRNYSSGEIFVTFELIRHFRPTKVPFADLPDSIWAAKYR